MELDACEDPVLLTGCKAGFLEKVYACSTKRCGSEAPKYTIIRRGVCVHPMPGGCGTLILGRCK